MEVSFDKPDHGWIGLTMGGRVFVLSSAPCDALSELVDALINALANGSRETEIDAEGETFRFEFTSESVTAYRSSHRELMVDEQIPIKKLVRKFLRAFEALETDSAGHTVGWGFRMPKLESLRALLHQ